MDLHVDVWGNSVLKAARNTSSGNLNHRIGRRVSVWNQSKQRDEMLLQSYAHTLT